MNVTVLKNDELVSKLGNLVKQERECTATIVQFLAEIDKPGYFRDIGYSSTSRKS